MKSRSFLGLLIFIVMTAASVEGAAANGTPIERGLAWLAQAQETDGSWGKKLDLQATAFSILALEAAGRDCAADVAHLRREVYGSPYELALQLLGTRESVIADRLLALREPDGGWGDLYTTALALMGLARAGRTDQAAAAYLLDRQNPDGSWGLEGTNEMTAVVTYALVSAGYAGAATDRALAWLREHQAPQGGFADPTATAWAILALRETVGSGETVARAAAWLRNARLSDGGWGWGKEPHGALYPTALIVRALAVLDPTDPAVEAGAAYLEARRNNGAGWYDLGLAAETTLRVAEILAALGRRDALAAAARWTEKLAPRNQAARAARFSFLLRYASITPEEKSRILAEFLAAEGPTGGWGCAPGYESDLLTTSMVLRALWDAGYADPQIYRRTVEFIRGRQRADGGFDLMPGEPGQIYVTAHLLLTLARLRPLAAVDAVVGPAAAWLLAERRADGSWGRGALETAMAFAAVADRLSVEEAEATRRYLEQNQEPDGSWQNDTLATALVLAALAAEN
ncbi:MAG: terpene cyclase/mutase family protein, partial [Firmicutes bacterium]|nr:terpene cyclase/mutase family protein [Bacillota bacterium]